MIAAALIAMVLIGFSSAQSTVSLFLPGTDNNGNLVASVVGTSGSVTSYAVQCASGTDSNNCGLPSPITFIEGPSTLHLSIGAPGFTMDVGCAISGSTSAVCVESATASDTSFGVSTTTLVQSEIGFLPVVVTAGAGVTGQASATATSSATQSSTSSGSSTASTGKTAAPGGSSSTSSTMATSTSGKPSGSTSSTGTTTAFSSSSGSATVANATHNVGVMQAVGGSGKGAMGACAVVLAMAMTML